MSDFTWVADYVISPSSEWNTLESEMENGVKQYRELWPTELQKWKLSFKNRTLTETLAILAFFNTKKGKAYSFTWTCALDSVEYTVRFLTKKFEYNYVGYQRCDFEIEFEEDTA